MSKSTDELFKNVISHAKEYGFVFQSSEIYDGLSAVYDYGQNGSELKNNIKSGKINSWKEVHDFYRQNDEDYEKNKLIHAYTSLLENENITSRQFTPAYFKELLQRSVATKTWASKAIYESRAKDYSNPFRKMIYENSDEMNTIMGKLEDNQFIQDQFKELDDYKKMVKGLIKKYL